MCLVTQGESCSWRAEQGRERTRRIGACGSSKWRIIVLISGSPMERVVPSTEQKVNKWFLNGSELEEILVLSGFGSLVWGLQHLDLRNTEGTYPRPCKHLVGKGGSWRRHLDSMAGAPSPPPSAAAAWSVLVPSSRNCAAHYVYFSLFSSPWILPLTLRPGIGLVFFLSQFSVCLST